MSRPATWWIRAFRILSVVLTVGSIGWVARLLLTHLSELPGIVTGVLALRVVSGIALYATLSVLLGIAWWWLLGGYETRPAPVTAYAIWARTQIAKYLPGNVFHLATRYVSAREAGVSHQGLAASMVFETAGVVTGAALVAVFAAVATHSSVGGPVSMWALAGVICATALLWPVVDRGLRGFSPTSRAMRGLPVLSPGTTAQLLIPALVLYVLFLSGTGGILYGLAGGGSSPARMIGAYATAWLAGTVVPGTPGGLGVREVVLVLQLAPLMGSAGATTLALALRVVTLAGDVLTATLGWLLSRRAATRPARLPDGASAVARRG